jgi:hypothetical protein
MATSTTASHVTSVAGRPGAPVVAVWADSRPPKLCLLNTNRQQSTETDSLVKLQNRFVVSVAGTLPLHQWNYRNLRMHAAKQNGTLDEVNVAAYLTSRLLLPLQHPKPRSKSHRHPPVLDPPTSGEPLPKGGVDYCVALRQVAAPHLESARDCRCVPLQPSTQPHMLATSCMPLMPLSARPHCAYLLHLIF